jgi:hypothetical protein
MGRRHDEGCGGGRWKEVGRGWRGVEGHVHRRNCANGRAEARIGRWGGDARGKFQDGFSLRVRRAMPRAAAEAQTIAPMIGQNGSRLKKIIVSRRIQHSPEEPFRSSALHIDDLYSAQPMWRARLEML